MTSVLAFPAIMNRLESYLIVMEGCQVLGLKVEPGYALEAFTKDSDNTEEHRSLQIHVQRGMGKNYERLEFLGDAFLKMATSIALFCQYPDDDEYDYHVNRMVLICNRNLFNAATKIGLYTYIRSRGFSRYVFHSFFIFQVLIVKPLLCSFQNSNFSVCLQAHMVPARPSASSRSEFCPAS